jgi:hypothetical protein
MSETVYLGIDLGTSRTSITTSTGSRETVWSYVGYPKDHVARKKFGGRDVIYARKPSITACHWTSFGRWPEVRSRAARARTRTT